MTYWEGPSRWINTALLTILGVIAFDALFLVLNAQEANLIVRVVRNVAGVFLVPFEGMFAGQPDLLTSAIAVLGYCLLAAIVLAVVRSIQASRRDPGSRPPADDTAERSTDDAQGP